MKNLIFLGIVVIQYIACNSTDSKDVSLIMSFGLQNPDTVKLKTIPLESQLSWTSEVYMKSSFGTNNTGSYNILTNQTGTNNVALGFYRHKEASSRFFIRGKEVYYFTGLAINGYPQSDKIIHIKKDEKYVEIIGSNSKLRYLKEELSIQEKELINFFN